jgi:hypothetical protein
MGRNGLVHGHRQLGFPAGGHAAHAVGHGVHLLQQQVTFTQQLSTCSGELGLAAAAVEEQHIERVFQLAHAVGQGRGYFAQLAGGGRKAARARDGGHHGQGFRGEGMAAWRHGGGAGCCSFNEFE